MKRTVLAILMGGFAILSVPAQQQFPQQPPPQQQDDDGYAPDHGVARISLANGDVSVRRGDAGDLTAAVQNGPLLVNDILSTGPNGRAEVQFDWGNLIRLAQDSEVRMGELEDRRYLVQIGVGTTTFRVLRDSQADVEISTPTVSVRPLEQGSYRVTVLQDGTTEITVRAGRAEILSPRGSEMLTAGRTMEARGTPSDPEFMINPAIPQDEWDRWNVDRDRLLERTSSYRYVSPDIVGAEELDQNGRWANDPEYGNVWVPSVDAGWAPYRVGRWEWVDFYGWTWISGDPFGWAPYHYGNWYQSPSFGWAWYPGPIGVRHYWRPALVGFFGWGSGGGFEFGFGNVGWVPLAPYERFRPWYGRGYNNTRIVTNVTVVNNYRNARFINGRNGVTSINANDFGRGRSINSNNFVRASNNDLARAGAVQGRLPFNASAESRRMSDRQVNPQSVPRINANTRFSQRGGGRNNANNGGGNNSGALGTATQGTFQGRQNQGFGQPNTGSVNRGRTNGGDNIGSNGGNNGGNNGGGFRRFDGGAPAPQTQQNPAPQANRGNNNGNGNNGGGWRRFDTGAAPNQGNPQINRGNQDRVLRENAPQRQSFPQQSEPQRQDQRQFRQTAPQQQAQPIQISPPIVRERVQQPRQDQPRFEQPRQDQPRFEQPRPQQQPRFEQPRPQQQPRFEQPRPQQQQPRFEQPRPQPQQQQPRMEQPRGNGGGNRGESRGNGGGGNGGGGDRGNGGGHGNRR